MKKNLLWLLWTASLLFLWYGMTIAQSIPSIGSTMTSSVISQPYAQSQCVEPDGSTVYVNRHFYLWDTYTTTDIVPKWGNGYDTLLLNASKVFIYNPALFNFTSSIQYKSNGIPNNAPVNNIVAAQGTFVVNSTNPWQLIYNIHRTALENGWSSSYSLSYLGRPNLINYTAQLNNKTFHNQAWRVVNGYECVNYTVHYCGDGVVDTQQSIASLNTAAWWSYTTSIANEQCDGTAWVPSGYTCTPTCTLQTTVVKPTCTLSVSPGTIQLWSSIQTSWSISGNYTNTPQITYTPTTWNITGLPYTITTPNGQRTIIPQHTGTYMLSMTVSNSAGSSVCTAPIIVNPAPQQLSCSLTVTPNNISPNQVVSVWWSVTGGNFFWTYIYVTPTIGWAWPHWVNANQYNGTTSVMPTQAGDYTFSMLVSNNQSSAACTGVLHVTTPSTPQLSLSKTLINNILYRSGDLIGFRIDFANIGNITVHNAILSDLLPPGLTYESSQIYGINQPYTFGTGITGNTIWAEYSWFTLTPGQQGYMILTGRFKWYQRSNQTWNHVFLDSNETSPLYASALFYVYTPDANATITKAVNKNTFYPGEDAGFTIAVTNNGPDAIDNVQIIDTWPNSSCIIADPLWTSNTPMTMTNSSNPYTWNLNASLPVGQTVYLYITWHIANTPSCVGTYINVVNLRYTVNGQLKTGQAQVNINVITLPSSNMTITKTALSYGNNVGDPVVFELIYQNNWTTTITSYNIVDYWPGTLQFVSSTPMPTSQTPTVWGTLLQRMFTTPIVPNGSGKIILNWIIK